MEQDRTRELNYINTPAGMTAIYERRNGRVNSMYYIHTDYLGSFQSITDQNGALVEQLSFDAWGRRRNATDWSYRKVPESFLFDRGFTGHEHLDKFGLINMNGRVYDPVLARFLSPDPVMQDPANTQDYNKYTYCLNNPLSYTDPSGNVYTGSEPTPPPPPPPPPPPIPNRRKSGQTITASVSNDEIMLAPADRHPEDWDSDTGTSGTTGTVWKRGILYSYGSGWDGSGMTPILNTNYLSGQGSFTGQIPATEHIINHDGYEYNPLTNILTIYFSGQIFVYSNVTGYMTSVDGEVVKISLDNIDNCTAYGSNIYSSHGAPSSSQYIYDFCDAFGKTLFEGALTIAEFGALGAIGDVVFAALPTGSEILSVLSRLFENETNFSSVGADALKNSADKVLQSGGHTIRNSTLKALDLTKEQCKRAIESLKDYVGRSNDFHGKIMGNGDYYDPITGEFLGNLYDYVY
jgi:RHS repeat-associated protein